MIGMFLYEMITKKDKKETATTRPHNSRPGMPSRPLPPSPPREQLSRPVPPAPPSQAPLRRESLVDRAARRRPIPSEGECALTGHHLHDSEAEAFKPESSPERPVPGLNDKEREAHFARWRQAVIDTQILERKF